MPVGGVGGVEILPQAEHQQRKPLLGIAVPPVERPAETPREKGLPERVELLGTGGMKTSHRLDLAAKQMFKQPSPSDPSRVWRQPVSECVQSGLVIPLHLHSDVRFVSARLVPWWQPTAI